MARRPIGPTLRTASCATRPTESMGLYWSVIVASMRLCVPLSHLFVNVRRPWPDLSNTTTPSVLTCSVWVLGCWESLSAPGTASDSSQKSKVRLTCFSSTEIWPRGSSTL